MPAQAGIQSRPLDSRFRGHDTRPQALAVYLRNRHLGISFVVSSRNGL